MERDLPEEVQLGTVSSQESKVVHLFTDKEFEQAMGDTALIPEEKMFSPSARQILRSQIQEIFSILTERESKVLQLRFGLQEDGRRRSSRETAAELGISPSTVRRDQKKALYKLRHPTRTKSIKDYR